MSKVIKKLAARRETQRASKHSGQTTQSKSMDDDSASSSPLTSPVSVASNEVFKKRTSSSYNSELMTPYGEEGHLRSSENGENSKISIQFDHSSFGENLEQLEDVSEGVFMELDESFYTETNIRNSLGSSSGKAKIPARQEAGRQSRKAFARSVSVQRPLQESSIAILERADDILQKSRRRSQSTGRSTRRDPTRAAAMNSYNAGKESDTRGNSNDDSESNQKKRKSKMEKILQLQDKNQRYKDEFRKVQKDRKALKKELEHKKLETAALTKEIDTFMAETSMLKLKLSEALQQLDRTDHNERKDKSTILKLQKELSAVRGDHNAAVGRVARMREEVEAMKVAVARKDEQIKGLTAEVAEQTALVDLMHVEKISRSTNDLDADTYHQLQNENSRLNKELGETLQNAASMVKEREDAIADLLRENEELKRLVGEKRDEQHSTNSSNTVRENDLQEEIAQLRAELDASAATLEEVQDRSVLLEEEIEAWIARGAEMENELERLRDDVEAWQTKAESAEESINVVEASAKHAAKKAASLEAALAASELRHKEQLQEQERKFKEAMWDLKERAGQRVAEAEKAGNNPRTNPQDDALRLAMEKKKARESANSGGSWGLISQLRGGKSEDQDDMSEEQKKIKELERTNAEQAVELEKAKSDLVQLLSTHRETKYTNEKRIEQLVEENKVYSAKQNALEIEVASLRQALARGSPDLQSESSHSIGSF